MLSQSGLLYLGLNPNGTGTVTLSDTATHTVGAELAVRDGTGTYNMLGGSLTVGTFLQVARNGHGTFSQAGGTLKVNQPTASAQAMFIAQGATGATGLYEISGGSLTVAGNNLGVVNGSVAGNTTGTFRIVGSAPTVTIGSNYVQNPGSKFETVIRRERHQSHEHRWECHPEWCSWGFLRRDSDPRPTIHNYELCWNSGRGIFDVRQSRRQPAGT